MHAAAAAAAMAEKSSSSIGLIPAAELMEKNIHHYGSSSTSSQERKKRLTSDQLESLERSFQEEIKLDPDRKMKLARELGLQPRQIAVWFQNRRARWKSKQLELLYDSLKQEYDAVSREKLKLQEEVISVKFFFHSFIHSFKRPSSFSCLSLSLSFCLSPSIYIYMQFMHIFCIDLIISLTFSSCFSLKYSIPVSLVSKPKSLVIAKKFLRLN